VFPAGCKKLKNSGSSLFQQTHAVEDVALGGVAYEALGWFVERFVTQAEGAEMHGHESFCLELEEGVDRLLGIHVDIALGRGVVGSDG